MRKQLLWVLLLRPVALLLILSGLALVFHSWGEV